jgi:hypothetical protein
MMLGVGDDQSIISKAVTQIKNYQEVVDSYDKLTLNHIEVSKFYLYEAPLYEKDDMKRVVLFSDNPLDV